MNTALVSECRYCRQPVVGETNYGSNDYGEEYEYVSWRHVNPDNEQYGCCLSNNLSTDSIEDMTRTHDGKLVWYVVVYEVDRAYGGREEGGWWYDCGEPVHQVVVVGDWADAVKVRDELRASEDWQDTGDVGSVLYSGGCYSVSVEDKPGEAYPQSRPRYS